jgi:anti-sigma regulatory factor (Ser/Thr protein kinase)
VPHRVAFHRTLELAPASAHLARRDLRALGLNPSELATTALLTSELLTNSVRHGDSAPDGGVELNVAVTDQSIRVEVRDGGPGFTPVARGPDAPLDCRWGLHLVDELSDRWGVAPDATHTVVWFEVDRA